MRILLNLSKKNTAGNNGFFGIIKFVQSAHRHKPPVDTVTLVAPSSRRRAYPEMTSDVHERLTLYSQKRPKDSARHILPKRRDRSRQEGDMATGRGYRIAQIARGSIQFAQNPRKPSEKQNKNIAKTSKVVGFSWRQAPYTV